MYPFSNCLNDDEDDDGSCADSNTDVYYIFCLLFSLLPSTIAFYRVFLLTLIPLILPYFYRTKISQTAEDSTPTRIAI